VANEFQARAGIMDVHYPRGFDRTAKTWRNRAYKGLMRGRAVVCPGMHNKLVPGCRASCARASSPARSMAASALGGCVSRRVRDAAHLHAMSAARHQRAHPWTDIIVALRTFLTLALPYFRSRTLARALAARGVIGASSASSTWR